MGVKSTITLTRKECLEQMLIEVHEIMSKVITNGPDIDNSELGEILESLREANGHYFDNYLVTDD